MRLKQWGKAWYGEPPQRAVHQDMSLEPAAREAKFRHDRADAIAEQHREMLAFLDNIKDICEEAIDKHTKAGRLTPAIEASLREAIWRVPIGEGLPGTRPKVQRERGRDEE